MATRRIVTQNLWGHLEIFLQALGSFGFNPVLYCKRININVVLESQLLVVYR